MTEGEWYHWAPVSAQPWRRLRCWPHDGTETPDHLAARRLSVHGCMRLADGTTPMSIVTTDNAQPHKYAPHAHLFTVGPMILLRDPHVVFEGTFPDNASPVRRRKPPDNWVPTPDLGDHLDGGWTPVGIPVSSTQGRVDDVKQNMEHYALSWPGAPLRQLSDLARWPLDARTIETTQRGNWSTRRGSDEAAADHECDEAHLSLTQTTVVMAWLQVWCVLMGRFLYLPTGGRQTWPFLLRRHELQSRLWQRRKTWGPTAPLALRSTDTEAAFPTYTRLAAAAATAATTPTASPTPAELAAHVSEWHAFLVNHSFTDALFAWFYMNANDSRFFQVCDDIPRRGTSWWTTRHFVPHALGTSASANATATFRVIQNMSAPLLELPAHPSKWSVICFSHPVVRFGMPLFASPLAPIARLLADAPVVETQYGHRAHVAALSVVWDVAVCMTIAQQKAFFRLMFTAAGGGVFSDLLKHVCRDARQMAADKSTSRQQSMSAMNRSALRNTSLAKVVGIPMSNRGPRDEGRVVQVVNRSALEHVNDGRPHEFQARVSIYHAARQLLDDAAADDDAASAALTTQMTRNSLSFFAPNHEVDVGRFYLYVAARLTNVVYHRETLRPLIQRGRLKNVVALHATHALDLGRAYFSVIAVAPEACEFDIWAALLCFWRGGRLPPTPAELARVFPVFWMHLAAHWQRYMRQVGLHAHELVMRGLRGGSNCLRQRLRQWVAIESQLSAVRLARFGENDPETAELCNALARFFKGTSVTPRQQWFVFFYLTHVIQPVPLDPSFFVAHTPREELDHVRAMPHDATGVPAGVELQRAVAHALLFSGVLWTTDVMLAWKRYVAVQRLPAKTASLIQTIGEFPRVDSIPLDAALARYAISHTLAVYAHREIDMPDGEIDDLKMAHYLTMALDVPDVVVVVRTEKELDARACSEIYVKTFGRGGAVRFHFIFTTDPSATALPDQIGGTSHHEWTQITLDWTHGSVPRPE